MTAVIVAMTVTGALRLTPSVSSTPHVPAQQGPHGGVERPQGGKEVEMVEDRLTPLLSAFIGWVKG